MFRIDPLTENGSIDVEFYISDDYSKHKKILENYLNQEGFENIEEPIVIQLQGQYWSVYDANYIK